MRHMLRNCFIKIILCFLILPLPISCSTFKDSFHPAEKTASPSEPPIKDEAYKGPKARVVLTKFIDTSSDMNNSGQTEEGVAEMLGNALLATNRFIVQMRLLENDSKQPIKGGDLLIEGTITRFETGKGSIIKTQPHVTFLLNVSDIKTGRKLVSQNVEGKAIPMEKAISKAIEESAKLIVAKTPSEYYRVSSSPTPPPPPPGESPKPQKTQPEITSAPPTPPPVKSEPSLPVIQVMWSDVNLREGPGTNYKKVGNIQQGTSMQLLKDKGNWLYVRLQSGKEVWLSKQATTLAPKTPSRPSSTPAPSSTPPRPNPM
jgi:curli biogenesis system outer membrane secretion channel CsgG